MKFPIKTCMCCGLDLTTAEPAEIKNPGEVALVGTCPQCSAPYFLVEDSAPLLDASVVSEPEPVAEPESSRARGGHRKASEPPAEPEPTSEPEPEPEPAPEE